MTLATVFASRRGADRHRERLEVAAAAAARRQAQGLEPLRDVLRGRLVPGGPGHPALARRVGEERDVLGRAPAARRPAAVPRAPCAGRRREGVLPPAARRLPAEARGAAAEAASRSVRAAKADQVHAQRRVGLPPTAPSARSPARRPRTPGTSTCRSAAASARGRGTPPPGRSPAGRSPFRRCAGGARSGRACGRPAPSSRRPPRSSAALGPFACPAPPGNSRPAQRLARPAIQTARSAGSSRHLGVDLHLDGVAGALPTP